MFMVEFEAQPFGPTDISRRSGRSNAFGWSSLVRVGEEAGRIALRPNALKGATGARSLARNVCNDEPISGVWRYSPHSQARYGARV